MTIFFMGIKFIGSQPPTDAYFINQIFINIIFMNLKCDAFDEVAAKLGLNKRIDSTGAMNIKITIPPHQYMRYKAFFISNDSAIAAFTNKASLFHLKEH